MPFVIEVLRGTLRTVLVLILSGMLATNFWVFWRRPKFDELLPKQSPPLSRWGGGSVVLVILAYLAIQLAVAAAFAGVLGSARQTDSSAAGKTNPIPSGSTRGVSSPSKVTTSETKVDRSRRAVPNPTELIAMNTVANLISVILLPLLLRGVAHASLADLGFSTERIWPDVRTGFLGFLLITPWVYGIQLLAIRVFESNQHPLVEMMSKESSPLTAVLAVVSAVLLAPLTEELLFRSVLLRWLNRLWTRRNPPEGLTLLPEPGDTPQEAGSLCGESGGILPEIEFSASDVPLDLERPKGVSWELTPVLLSSLPFALLHAPQMPAPFPIFLLSVALGVVAQRTGRLTASMTLHACFNLVPTLFLINTLLTSSSGR